MEEVTTCALLLGQLTTVIEGTKAIKDSKLQRLTISFEEIKMEEDELFDEFYAKPNDIVNSTFNLGETITKSKIVERCSDFYPRDSMPRLRRLRNQRILTRSL